jgi:hypothetical protein
LVAVIRGDWTVERFKRLEKNNPNRQRKIGGGRKMALPMLEDQLLLTLVWANLYSSYLMLEYLFGIDESTVSRLIGSMRLLLQDRFVIPDPRKQKGRKKITTLEELKKALPPDIDLSDILVDGTEQMIPRPEKKRKRTMYHSGKKKRFTVKTQIATTRNGWIVQVSPSVPGRMHDYKLFKASILPKIIPKDTRLYGDSGYQGIRKDFPDLQSHVPFKRTRTHHVLTRSEKIRNTKQRKIRVKIEHAFSRLKKYAVLAQPFRHSLHNYDSTFRFVANLANFRMIQRYQLM